MRLKSCVALVTLALFAIASDTTAGIIVGQTTQITSLPGIEQRPSLSGDIVVWQDGRTGTSAIYGYNLQTKQEFSVAADWLAKGTPQISGSIVAWAEKSSGYGYGYAAKDLSTGTTYSLISGMGGYIGSSSLAIVDRKVYYSVYDKMDLAEGVYSTDLDTGVRARVSPASSDHQYDVDADSQWVVWSEGGWLRVHNVATGETGPRMHTPWGGSVSEPVLAGGKIYYTGNYNSHTTDNRIESYDIATGAFNIISNIVPTTVAHPSADGSIVIWTDYGSMPAKSIEGFDSSTGERFRVVDQPSGAVAYGQQSFEIDNRRVVWTWTNSNSSNMDVYMTEFVPEPATLSLLGVGGLTLLRRRAGTSLCRPHS